MPNQTNDDPLHWRETFAPLADMLQTNDAQKAFIENRRLTHGADYALILTVGVAGLQNDVDAHTFAQTMAYICKEAFGGESADSPEIREKNDSMRMDVIEFQRLDGTLDDAAAERIRTAVRDRANLLYGTAQGVQQ